MGADAATTGVVIIGAGLSGLNQLHRLREAGLDCRGIEKAAAYPGARCDVESMAYSDLFSPELE